MPVGSVPRPGPSSPAKAWLLILTVVLPLLIWAALGQQVSAEEPDPSRAPEGKWVWLWQWELTDHSLDEVMQRLLTAGVDGILVKVIDGETSMSRWDDRFYEFSEVKAVAESYGLKAAAWVWGYPDERVLEQAEAVGQFAADHQPAYLVLNLEHAWNGHRDEAMEYASRIREIAQDVPLFYAPDPRIFPYNWTYPYAELNAVTDGVMLMVYWHEFGWDPVDALRNAQAQFARWQSNWPNPYAPIYPIAQTYGGATAEELAAFQQAVLEDGLTGISYYVYNHMEPYWPVVEAFSFPEPVEPEPAPPATLASGEEPETAVTGSMYSVPVSILQFLDALR